MTAPETAPRTPRRDPPPGVKVKELKGRGVFGGWFDGRREGGREGRERTPFKPKGVWFDPLGFGFKPPCFFLFFLSFQLFGTLETAPQTLFSCTESISNH